MHPNLYTKEHFTAERNFMFNLHWEDYLDNDLTPEARQSLNHALSLESNFAFFRWLDDNEDQVFRYIEATPEQRATEPTWQAERHLFAYARWHILCKGEIIYEWLKQRYDPPYLTKSEETLSQLVYEQNRLLHACDSLPIFPVCGGNVSYPSFWPDLDVDIENS
ncbi:hypothetical protein A4G19_03600 [Pasteurellaceae bacterium Macca]|nr:hypothetical protein [Pasteurellaceae bacterium Macca]